MQWQPDELKAMTEGLWLAGSTLSVIPICLDRSR